jgi:hypothetical protein
LPKYIFFWINYNNFDMNVFRKYQNNKPDMHCGGKLFDHGVKSSPAQ